MKFKTNGLKYYDYIGLFLLMHKIIKLCALMYTESIQILKVARYLKDMVGLGIIILWSWITYGLFMGFPLGITFSVCIIIILLIPGCQRKYNVWTPLDICDIGHCLVQAIQWTSQEVHSYPGTTMDMYDVGHCLNALYRLHNGHPRKSVVIQGLDM